MRTLLLNFMIVTGFRLSETGNWKSRYRNAALNREANTRLRLTHKKGKIY